MTHYGLYYGIPVYIGNLEFAGVQPIEVAIKYKLLNFPFHCINFIEWLFTPPNHGSMFLVGREIE